MLKKGSLTAIGQYVFFDKKMKYPKHTAQTMKINTKKLGMENQVLFHFSFSKWKKAFSFIQCNLNAIRLSPNHL